MPPKVSKGKAPANRCSCSRPGSLIGTNSKSQFLAHGNINQPGVVFGQSTIARTPKLPAGGRETPIYLSGPSFMVSSPTDGPELNASNSVMLSKANVEAALSQVHEISLWQRIDRVFPDPPMSLTQHQSESGQNSICG